jgi:phosphoserine phosphatase RsbU/P
LCLCVFVVLFPMRIFPRIARPKFKRLIRRVGKWRRYFTIARTFLLVEILALFFALLFVLSGNRAVSLDRLGHRADLLVFTAAIALFGLAHFIVARSIVPVLERRFSPAPYDERRILFDLGQEAQAATNLNQLYELIVKRIGEALETENVSILVRYDPTGDYICRISTQKATSREVKNPVLARNAFMVKRLRSLRMPVDISQQDFDTWKRAFSSAPRSLREARDHERQTLEQIRSSLLVPIRIKEQLVGILSLGPRRTQHTFSTADREMLLSVAGQLAFVIENSKLVERMVAEEQLRLELELATEVQQRLFPSNPPSSDSIELAGFCQPAHGVGGDYYDFLLFNNEQTGIAIADVSGKGISAALLMSIVQASLRSQALADDAGYRMRRSPAELVSTLNQLLCLSTGAENYVTFFYGQFDARTRLLTYVNAGHNPPFLIQARNSYCTRLVQGGSVIGLFKHFRYEQETIQMYSGDLLVAYTDGVTEAVNSAGEEFGEARLQEALMSAAHLSVTELRGEILRLVQEWCSGVPQHDDLTFVALKVK